MSHVSGSRMHESDVERRIVDLAEYRARRAARRPRAARYVLWYPGWGCIDPAPQEPPRATADRWSSKRP